MNELQKPHHLKLVNICIQLCLAFSIALKTLESFLLATHSVGLWGLLDSQQQQEAEYML
jgi:hypothetical protein